MHRHIVSAATVLSAAFGVVLSDAQAQGPDTRIEWKVDRVKSAQSVQMGFEWRTRGGHSMWTDDRRVAELPGLNVAQLQGRGGPVRFSMPRPAGRLDCTGQGGNGRGRGTCGFTPDPAFANLLAAQGMARPTWQQSLSLAMSDVDRPLIQSLAQLRHLRPTIDQLVAMAIHGVDGNMVRSVARANLPIKSVDDVVSLRIHGANAAWIDGLARFAPRLRHLTGSDLVSLRIHGASPEWIGEMAAAMGPAFSTLSGSELTSMRIHGAKPAMVAAYVRTFGGRISGSDITSMAIHGVTADFIAKVAARGYRNVSGSDLVSMRLHGIPDRDRTS